ncbi:potassium-transporting ATPase subunit KdpA [Methylocapsa polymorpha]|uniref:Potassium-transporting ATPase potassium-binding subunit n=1 Tax=Methylocapsa polymorpha TaxID=3080828 RepID=A0ABZ0HNH2_9HYPH|nr:potassium-transporting ATPase subunit KdpA [Methylocapsa sp. RX1]
MTLHGWLLILLFALLLGLTIKPLGGYMAWVFTGGPASIWFVGWLECGFFRMAGVDPKSEQNWLNYAVALLAFNFVGIILLFAILFFQDVLPLNPQRFGPMAADLAFNTAVSFVTNTSWQSYGGETTLGYFSQMAGVTVQSFLSAATGVAVAIAMTRGFARHGAAGIGNAWVDVSRATLYVLLPLAVIGALFLAWQGAPQTLGGSVEAAGLEGAVQLISRGPVASQEAIKLLSGDGGGFFNANSAHPFENPTALTNLVEILLIFLIGGALTNTFGRMVGDERQGWSLFGAMVALFAAGLCVVYFAEASGNSHFASLGVDQAAGPLQAGGNMEGKEVRFGVAGSALFANVATTSSDGAVNAMHDSFTPLGGGMLMANMMMDEVIVGAPGSGLFGMLLYALVAVFVAGLMVGRTPEYLGNKIESAEVKMAVLALLVVPATILFLTSIAAVVPAGLAGLSNAGPHGFSELLYAYTSAAATNGSAFAGLSANTPFFNLTLALAMLSGRFLVIVPVLAIAGSLAAKKRVPISAGTLPTDGMLFVFLIVGTVLILGALTFFPALALGPLAELYSGRQLY